LENADLRQGKSGPDQKSGSDDFQHLMGTSLSKDASVTKFSRRSFSRDMTNQIVEKMPYLAMLCNPSNNS